MDLLMRPAQPISIKPKRLESGAIIGVVAPASPFNRDELEQGLSVLHAMGFGTQLADGLFERNSYLAGDDQLRADQLHSMFLDDRVDAIMCARGGYGSLRILPLLDYALFCARPKPFIGFSDITALHHALYRYTGMVTFHGPMVCTLANSDAQSRASWQQVLCAKGLPPAHGENTRALQPGRSQGRFLGGNLATLCHLLGTPFAPEYQGCILFIEETGEMPYRIDRMLVQMKLAGCFEHLAGVVLGSFKNCGDAAQIDRLMRQMFDKDIPILAGIDAGHANRNLTLPLGIMAALDADQGEIRFLEDAVL
jgi:muramoyltetrapeptide carboxypeptidase